MKILRAYTGYCESCTRENLVLSPDGRSKNIRRYCDHCHNGMILIRDKEKDQPLKQNG